MPYKPPVKLAAPPPRKKPPKPKPMVAAAPLARPKKRRGRQKSMLSNLIYLTVIVGLLFGLLPTALILVVGGLPTLVAVIVDRHPRHYLSRCVAFTNLAGITPYLLQIWAHHTTIAAMQMLIDPFVWLVMYGAAAVGWLIYLSAPSIAWLQVELMGSHRANVLKSRQRKLIEEWGDEVATTAAGG
jgi:hypothetical protein